MKSPHKDKQLTTIVQAHQTTMDRSSNTDLLKQFYIFWFKHPQYWFKSSEREKCTDIDTYISTTFGKLLDIGVDEDITISGKEGEIELGVARILIYDQLPRHVFRKEPASHIIDYFLQHAVKWSGSLCPNRVSTHTRSFESLNSFKSFNPLYKMTTPCWIFWALPLRHAGVFDPKVAWQRLLSHEPHEHHNDPNDKVLMHRFIKAMYNKMAEKPDLHIILKPYTTHKTIHDTHKECMYNTLRFNHILANPENAIDFQINTLAGLAHEPIASEFEKYLRGQKDKIVMVSLSGGVDSMLVCSILWALRDVYKYNLVAVHINYCNKESCNDDEDLICMYCSHLRVPLTIRRIVEIQREPCMRHELRDVYESYTKKVRFATYRSVASSISVPENRVHSDHPLVFLGHNHDDCLENIITNISNNQKFENLHGMDALTPFLEEGFTFCRPLLSTTKQKIRTLANEYCIPYLQDSTPSWSQRGKIRDKLVPAMTSWSLHLTDGLFQVSETMRFMHEHFLKSIARIIQQRKFEAHEWSLQTTFWKLFFSEALLQGLYRGTHIGKAHLETIHQRLVKFTSSNVSTRQGQEAKNNKEIQSNCRKCTININKDWFITFTKGLQREFSTDHSNIIGIDVQENEIGFIIGCIQR